MRNRIFFFITLALLPVCRGEITFPDTYTGFALPADPVLPEVESHPSLWFGPEDVPGLIAKRDADAHAAMVWDEVAQSEFLLAPLPEIPSASDGTKTIHKYYGTLTQIAAINGFYYQVSPGESGEPFLAKAREALLRGYAGPLYELDPIIKGSAVDEIYQAVWAQNFAAAYDWVQPALSPEENKAIRANLANHAEYLYENLFSWADSPHNHLSKPAWGLGTLALCLSGDERAGAWLGRAIAASNGNTRYFFGEDGIYREGSHYYTFSLINFLPFLYHYRNVSGVDGFREFQPAFEWPVASRNGKGWIPNIEDSYIRPYPSQLVAGAYRGRPTFLSSSASLAEILQWNFENTDYSPFEAAEVEDGFNYTGATWDYPIHLVEYLCYQPGIKAVAPDAGPTLFGPSGQTVFRNDWSFDSPDHRYLLFQGVAEANNHEHYEHLSFILQAENQMMSSDAGYSRGSYAGPERTAWYKTAEAHNVVMVNGQAPVDRRVDRTPDSSFRLLSPFMTCEIKSAPYAVGGEHQRLIAMIDGRWFAIVDRVELPQTGEIAVVMHGGRAQLSQDGPRSLWSYREDAYGPAAVLGQWFFGDGFQFEERSGELTYIKGDYAAFPYTVNTRSGKAMLSVGILDPASSPESLSEFAVDALASDRIAFRGGRTLMQANGSGDRQLQGDLESDARLAVAWMKEGGEPTRLAMVGGRYLRFSDGIKVELSAPAAIALEYEPGEKSVVVHLSEDGEVRATITTEASRWEGALYPGLQDIVFGP
ncbi:MAG: heparinase II/III family protein [Opitutaceae bacterium]